MNVNGEKKKRVEARSSGDNGGKETGPANRCTERKNLKDKKTAKEKC